MWYERESEREREREREREIKALAAMHSHLVTPKDVLEYVDAHMRTHTYMHIHTPTSFPSCDSGQ